MFRHGLFISSFSNSMKVKQAKSAGEQASINAADVRNKSEEIASDVEKILMITEALWIFIKEQHGLNDEHLINLVQEIDLRDGKLDGKVAKQESPNCPHCGRKLMRNHAICIYCGAAVSRSPFER